MIEKKELKLLPIGTVCKIKEKNVEVMIIGYFDVDKNTKVVKDYKAVVYPYGVLNLDYYYTFNEKDIEKVLFEGYHNLNYDAFLLGVNKAINNVSFKDIFN